MRVALVNQPWGQVVPPVVTGGSIPVLLYEIARRLARRCEVLYYTRGAFGWREIVDQAVRYRYLPIAYDKAIMKLLGRLGNFSDFRKPLFASRQAYLVYGLQLAVDLRRQHCDVVHIINISQLVPIVRRFNPRIRIILHMQCEWLNQLDRELLAPRLAQCDLILGCSSFITQKVKDRFPELADRCVVLYNGVDIERFDTRRNRLTTSGAQAGFNGDSPRIVFVGRITPEKGVHTLLDAFARVARVYPHSRLEIVGPEEINPPELVVPFSADRKVFDLLPYFTPGKYRELLDQKLRGQWGRQVQFLGNLPQSGELMSRYQSADVCVIPSVWEEPFGIPVIEAMAAGVPVVATRGGAFPEIVHHGKNGLLVDRGDPVQLADAIIRLLEQKPLRQAMGQAGRQRAVDTFSWDRISTDFLEAICSTHPACYQPANGKSRRRSLPGEARRANVPCALRLSGKCPVWRDSSDIVGGQYDKPCGTAGQLAEGLRCDRLY